jgi:hypothetical protein
MPSTSILRRRVRLAMAVIAAAVTLAGLGPARPAAAFACGEVDVRVQFVCNTYSAVAGRSASTADLDYWVPKMPAQRTFFVATVARSGEGRHLTVERYYSRFFETGPSPADHAFWDPLVTQPNGLRKLEAALLADRPDTQEFVTQAFSSQLNREPTVGELEYWGDRADATSKNKVAAELSNVLEVRRARVRGLYLNDLGYAPDEASRAYWAERLRTGTSYLDVRIGIRSSADAYPGNRSCVDAAAPQVEDLCAV